MSAVASDAETKKRVERRDPDRRSLRRARRSRRLLSAFLDGGIGRRPDQKSRARQRAQLQGERPRLHRAAQGRCRANACLDAFSVTLSIRSSPARGLLPPVSTQAGKYSDGRRRGPWARSTGGRPHLSRSSGSSASIRRCWTTAGRPYTCSTCPVRRVIHCVVVVSAVAEDRRTGPGASELPRTYPTSIPGPCGSLDENDVLGYAGIPVNAKRSMPRIFLFNVRLGRRFFPAGRHDVSVDSGRDLFNGRPLGVFIRAPVVGERRETTDRHSCFTTRDLAWVADDVALASATPPRASIRCRCFCSSVIQTWKPRVAATSFDAETGPRGLLLFIPRAESAPGRAPSSCVSSPPTSRRRRTSTPRAY